MYAAYEQLISGTTPPRMARAIAPFLVQDWVVTLTQRRASGDLKLHPAKNSENDDVVELWNQFVQGDEMSDRLFRGLKSSAASWVYSKADDLAAWVTAPASGIAAIKAGLADDFYVTADDLGESDFRNSLTGAAQAIQIKDGVIEIWEQDKGGDYSWSLAGHAARPFPVVHMDLGDSSNDPVWVMCRRSNIPGMDQVAAHLLKIKQAAGTWESCAENTHDQMAATFQATGAVYLDQGDCFPNLILDDKTGQATFVTYGQVEPLETVERYKAEGDPDALDGFFIPMEEGKTYRDFNTHNILILRESTLVEICAHCDTDPEALLKALAKAEQSTYPEAMRLDMEQAHLWVPKGSLTDAFAVAARGAGHLDLEGERQLSLIISRDVLEWPGCEIVPVRREPGVAPEVGPTP